MSSANGLIRPMLATAGPVPTGPGWAFEFKWDGIRAIGYAGPDGTRLVTRNDRDVSQGYPEIVDLGGAPDMVLDGELVALDPRGRPDFGLLQRRIHVRPGDELLAEVPVYYYVFDLLRLDGRLATSLPYLQRRELLAGLDVQAHPRVEVPPSFTDADGATVLSAASENGLEGVLAKRCDSVYRPGRRDRSWIKTPLRRRQEVIVCGWTEGKGNRSATIGALHLGAYDAGRLVYIGDVGTGFTDQNLTSLHRRLRELEQPDPPFPDPVPREVARDAHWCRPELVGDVEYRSWTPDHRLRHPSWKGLRPDRRPDEAVVP